MGKQPITPEAVLYHVAAGSCHGKPVAQSAHFDFPSEHTACWYECSPNLVGSDVTFPGPKHHPWRAPGSHHPCGDQMLRNRDDSTNEKGPQNKGAKDPAENCGIYTMDIVVI